MGIETLRTLKTFFFLRATSCILYLVSSWQRRFYFELELPLNRCRGMGGRGSPGELYEG